MKIRITRVDIDRDGGILSLEQCGFKVGDIVDVDGFFHDGSYCVLAIRNAEEVGVGDKISVSDDECEVLDDF